MKQVIGAPPTLNTGQRVKQGEFAKLSKTAIQQISGGKGVQIRSFGNRHTVSVKAKKGASGLSAPRLVATLPAIPSGYDAVVWASSAYITGGTGDNFIWECDGRVGQTKWTQRQAMTDKSGVPV